MKLAYDKLIPPEELCQSQLIFLKEFTNSNCILKGHLTEKLPYSPRGYM